MAEEQVLIVNLQLRDNLSLGVGKIKDQIGNFGDQIYLQAAKANDAIGNLGDNIRTRFAAIGTDIKKGIALGLGIGTVQLIAQAANQIKSFFEDSIKASIEQEASTARLTQALKENIPAWDGDTHAIEAAVKAAQAKGFQDQQAEESLAHLSAATHDATQAIALQSVAMDLARFRGISLADASDKLIRVIGGSSRVAKELGIDFKNTSTTAERLALIEGVVAGQADAFGKTTAGAFARAGEAVHQFQEQIGAPLADAFATFATGALAAAKALTGFNIAVDYANEHGLKPPAQPDTFRIPGIADAIDALTGLAKTNRDVTADMIVNSQQAALAAVKTTEAIKEQAHAFTVAAETAAGLSYEQGTLTAADTALTDAEAAAAKEVDKQAAANLALQTTMEQNIQTSKTWSGRLADNAMSAQFFTTKVYGAVDALDELTQRLQHGGGRTVTRIGGDVLDAGTGQSGTQLFLDDLAAKGAARDKAEADRLAKLKDGALAYAQVLKDKLAGAFTAAKDVAQTLFDKLHDRHLQAIADTEKLAEKQHDAATQQINDALKLKLQQDAAPVTAAEEAQNRIELARQRRDLGANLQVAQQSGDPLAIRNAQEALESFNAAQRIAGLRETQAKLDLAAQIQAAADQKAADAALVAAKFAEAGAIKAELLRSKDQKRDFDLQLAALQKRDAGTSPAKAAADIEALQARFGITTDPLGFHHIGDVIATAIKSVKITVPIPQFFVTVNSPPIFLNGRLIAAALSSSQSPSATPGVRQGALQPRP